ncbi:sugar transferase [Clostridium sp.]
MHNSNKLAFFDLFHLITDALALIVSYYIAYNITADLTVLNGIWEYSWIILIYIPIWIFVMAANGMYNVTTFTYYDRIFRNSLGASVFSSSIILALMYAIKENMYNKILFLNFFLIAIIIMLIEKYLVLYVFKIKNGESTKQVLVIGVNSMYEQFKYYVNKTNIKVNVVRFIGVDESQSLNQCAVLLHKDNFRNILRTEVIDEIYFALPIKYFKEIQEYLLIAEEMGITSRVLLDLVEMKFSRINVASLGTLPMITFHSVSLNRLQLSIKRVIDIIGAIVGLVITSVFWIGEAIAIKINSPGPIIFAQNRVGMNGRIFKLYKFRSMYIDAEEKRKDMEAQNENTDGFMFKIKDDPRVTSVGKFIRKTSLDELPQFFNVLKGDMSLVGTRPPTVDEVKRYKNYHRRRISIKPGITGMWQVSGRSAIKDFDEVVHLDTKYIDEWSVGLDIKIMIKTILVVFAKRGAS